VAYGKLPEPLFDLGDDGALESTEQGRLSDSDIALYFALCFPHERTALLETHNIKDYYVFI